MAGRASHLHPPAAARRRPVQALRELLGDDRFTRVRTEAELGALVAEVSRTSSRPYAELLHGLIGADPEVDEAVARKLWMASVDHKRALRHALGREVLLRVAMLDLFSTNRDFARIKPPLVVSPRLLASALKTMATDPLTGLLRRDEFAAIVAHELRQRNKTPPVLAYLDIDNFKAVNDTHGHETGDQVLANLGSIIRGHGRQSDAFARLGGDEIAGLLIECGVAGAREIVGRIRAAFLAATAGLGVDLAVGLSVARKGESTSEFIARADRAMYAVKRRQRRPTRGPRRVGSPIALAVVRDPDMLVDVHARLSALGVLTVPARTVDAARSLFALLKPSVVAASDSRDAEAWLVELAREHPSVRLLRLLSEGAPAQRPIAGEVLVRRPFAAAGAGRSLRLAAGRPGMPVRALSGAREARNLVLAVERLLEGRLSKEAARSLGTRPELDLVRRHLGA